MKLLIVDDHADSRSMIRDFVGHVATEVYESSTGEAAMRQCLERVPDLITLDLRMGVVDGMAVLEFVRSVCPSVHAVVVTQHDDPQLLALIKRQGAARCFSKSNLMELRSYVERWWSRRASAASTAIT
jgi:DNA-binding NarL/FixJ family response regulator